MRLADTKYLTLAVCLAAAGVSAAPGLGSAEPQGVTAAAGTASEAPARKAGEITIGKEAPRAAESLKDLEALQRQVYVLELRNKLKELSAPASGSVASTVAPPLVVTQPFPAGARPGLAPFTMAPPSLAATPPDEQPSARLQSVIVVNNRARADVVTNGSVTTVKEGDELGDGWRVTSIKPGSVRVEKVVTRSRPDPNAGAPANLGRGKKPATPAAGAMVPYQRTLTAALRPVDKMSADGMQHAVQPVIPPLPPLPGGLRRTVDSTSVPAAIPLGPGLPQQVGTTEWGGSTPR